MARHQDGETLGRKIAVISALGGQGCSLAAAGMGLAAAELGKSVTLLDLCGFGGTLAHILSVEEQTVMHMGDVLSGVCDAEDALIECGGQLRLLAAPVFGEGETDPRSVGVRRLVERFARDTEVIADWPSGVVPDCGSAGCFDVFVICACADTLSLRFAAALRRRIRRAVEEGCGSADIRLLLTRFSPETLRDGGVDDLDDCIDRVGARLLGVIPFDGAAGHAVKNGVRPDPGGEAWRYCRDAVRRLYGEKVPLDARTSLLSRRKG